MKVVSLQILQLTTMTSVSYYMRRKGFSWKSSNLCNKRKLNFFGREFDGYRTCFYRLANFIH